MKMIDSKFYSSQSQEQFELIKLKPNETIPTWLTGKLLRNGPALFEAGTTKLRHWFDGYGMIHSFVIQQGEVFYHSKFIESPEYLNAKSTGKNTQLTWGTASDPCRSIFRRLMSNLTVPPTNTPVNIVREGDSYFATSDIGAVNQFNPDTLDTLSTKLNGGDGVLAAHPAFLANGEVWNMKSLFAPFSDTTFVKMTEATLESKASFRTKKKYYFHSFAAPGEYLISIEQPMYLSLAKIMTSGIFNRSYFECYDWDAKTTNVLHIHNRVTGDTIHIPTSHTFFFFHVINSYQVGDKIMIDFCGYKDNYIIKDFYLDVLQTSGIKEASKAKLMTLTIDLVSHETSLETFDVQIELPNIDHKLSGTNLKYIYGVHSTPGSPYLADSIIKYDKMSKTSVVWKEENLLPGEPVFVANPNATSEDDGILLTVCYDTELSESSLVILDARTMHVVSHVVTPHRIPASLHGSFYYK